MLLELQEKEQIGREGEFVDPEEDNFVFLVVAYAQLAVHVLAVVLGGTIAYYVVFDLLLEGLASVGFHRLLTPT